MQILHAKQTIGRACALIFLSALMAACGDDPVPSSTPDAGNSSSSGGSSCGIQNSECGGSNPSCCEGLTCGTDGFCAYPCRMVGESCNDSDPMLTCCTGVSFCGGTPGQIMTCQACVALNQPCNDSKECCSGLQCFGVFPNTTCQPPE